MGERERGGGSTIQEFKWLHRLTVEVNREIYRKGLFFNMRCDLRSPCLQHEIIYSNDCRVEGIWHPTHSHSTLSPLLCSTSGVYLHRKKKNPTPGLMIYSYHCLRPGHVARPDGPAPVTLGQYFSTPPGGFLALPDILNPGLWSCNFSHPHL